MWIQRIWNFATIFTVCSLTPVAASTGLSQTAPLTGSQWDTLRERVNLLDKIAFLPSLLPVIMKNRDALELSDTQVAAFQEWRKRHYQKMPTDSRVSGAWTIIKRHISTCSRLTAKTTPG